MIRLYLITRLSTNNKNTATAPAETRIYTSLNLEAFTLNPNDHVFQKKKEIFLFLLFALREADVV